MERYIYKTILGVGFITSITFVLLIMTGGFNSTNDDGDTTDNMITSQSEIRSDLTSETEIETEDSEFTFDGMPIYGEWTVYTKENGLPSNKVNTVKIDDDRILAGTDRGLAILQNGEWTVYTKEDGLAHRNVMSIDINPDNGDVWIGTMNGLNRWSAGVFERFDQFNSGLANDVVYEVRAGPRYTWVATAAGASRFDTYTDQWLIFNEETAPLHEPWTYGVTTAGNITYIAAWGGGVVEYNNDTEKFRVYMDPDGHFQVSLFPDDGLVHDIATAVAYDDGILWVSTYFGLSRYNGQQWWGYFPHNSGITSDFLNNVKAKYSVGYIATDDGFNTFDGTTWVTYKPSENGSGGETTITRGDIVKKEITETSISHGFIWNMDIREDVVWVATSYGLSMGKVIGTVDDVIL